MKDIYSWAENECRIACKKENPNFNFDGDDFDYGCSCYKSALKAYNSLVNDDHSGYSFNQTKFILTRLMDGHPLTPITDEDFFSVERGTDEHPLESEDWLKEHGLKSDLQCPRMFSLFRKETLDGKVSYYDVDRAYYVNIEDPSDTYSSWCGFIDDMFPITMPYMPKKGKYQIYAQTFLTDKKHGDFDTKGIFYVITPDGERVDVNIFRTEGDDGKWRDITKEEYDELLAKRIDKLNDKIATHLIWTLISNSGNEQDIEFKESQYDILPDYLKDKWYDELSELCKFYNDPEHYQYNTFGYCQAMCKGNIDVYKNVPELVKIAEYLNGILNVVMNVGDKE